ncbi:MAG: hypothetical protein FJ044_00300 [Candidatus Cloacimonetes bacterium]|nr:hypothetical protein [Candidatus Cloacimonadota bacterium]
MSKQRKKRVIVKFYMTGEDRDADKRSTIEHLLNLWQVAAQNRAIEMSGPFLS